MLSFSAIFRFILISWLLFLAGCATQDKKSTMMVSKPPAAAKNWSVVLSISGGFAGWAKNISINSDGLLIINNLKTGRSIRKKMNNNELDVLSKLVLQQKKTHSEAKGNSLPKNCADCFQYKLSIRWQNGQQLAVLNDINLGQSPYKDIVRFLRKMMSQH